MLIKLIVEGILLVLLAISNQGCRKSLPTLEFFLLHPDQIQSAFRQCYLEQGQRNLLLSQDCAAVLQALPLIDQYINELSRGTHFFGLRIMQAQIRLVELKQQLINEQNQTNAEHKKITELQNAIQKQNLIIQSRYAIIRFIRGR
jgi:hypothetical protein